MRLMTAIASALALTELQGHADDLPSERAVAMLDTEPMAQTAKDEADGAALRRLREALPGHVVTVKGDAAAYGLQWLVSAEDGPDSAFYALENTIAEAADKCREALSDAASTR